MPPFAIGVLVMVYWLKGGFYYRGYKVGYKGVQGRLILGLFLFFSTPKSISSQPGQISDLVIKIQKSKPYAKLKLIARRNERLVIGATDDIFTARRYIRTFSQSRLKATKNIIQRAIRLFGKKKRLNLLVVSITTEINRFTHEINIDRPQTSKSLAHLTKNLFEMARLFDASGHFRNLPKLTKNIQQMILLLDRCKVIIYNDPVLYELINTFPHEPEIGPLVERLKNIRRKSEKGKYNQR